MKNDSRDEENGCVYLFSSSRESFFNGLLGTNVRGEEMIAIHWSLSRLGCCSMLAALVGTPPTWLSQEGPTTDGPGPSAKSAEPQVAPTPKGGLAAELRAQLQNKELLVLEIWERKGAGIAMSSLHRCRMGRLAESRETWTGAEVMSLARQALIEHENGREIVSQLSESVNKVLATAPRQAWRYDGMRESIWSCDVEDRMGAEWVGYIPRTPEDLGERPGYFYLLGLGPFGSWIWEAWSGGRTEVHELSGETWHVYHANNSWVATAMMTQSQPSRITEYLIGTTQKQGEASMSSIRQSLQAPATRMIASGYILAHGASWPRSVRVVGEGGESPDCINESLFLLMDVRPLTEEEQARGANLHEPVATYGIPVRECRDGAITTLRINEALELPGRRGEQGAPRSMLWWIVSGGCLAIAALAVRGLWSARRAVGN